MFAFIMIRQEAKWERERGAGSGKALEPRFKLWTPVTQQRYISVHLPLGYHAMNQISIAVSISASKNSENVIIKLKQSLCWIKFLYFKSVCSLKALT